MAEFNKDTLIKSIGKSIKEYANIKADRTKIQADMLANELKARQNWFYKKKQMDYQTPMQKEMTQRFRQQQQQGGPSPGQTIYNYGPGGVSTKQPSQEWLAYGAARRRINQGRGTKEDRALLEGFVEKYGPEPEEDNIYTTQDVESIPNGFEIVGYDSQGRPTLKRKESAKKEEPFALKSVKDGVPEGYEIVGYDSQGDPMIRKTEELTEAKNKNIEIEKWKKGYIDNDELINKYPFDEKVSQEITEGLIKKTPLDIDPLATTLTFWNKRIGDYKGVNEATASYAISSINNRDALVELVEGDGAKKKRERLKQQGINVEAILEYYRRLGILD